MSTILNALRKLERERQHRDITRQVSQTSGGDGPPPRRRGRFWLAVIFGLGIGAAAVSAGWVIGLHYIDAPELTKTAANSPAASRSAPTPNEERREKARAALEAARGSERLAQKPAATSGRASKALKARKGASRRSKGNARPPKSFRAKVPQIGGTSASNAPTPKAKSPVRAPKLAGNLPASKTEAPKVVAPKRKPRTELVKAKPVKAESVKAEPVKIEPVKKPERVKAEATKLEVTPPVANASKRAPEPEVPRATAKTPPTLKPGPAPATSETPIGPPSATETTVQVSRKVESSMRAEALPEPVPQRSEPVPEPTERTEAYLSGRGGTVRVTDERIAPPRGSLSSIRFPEVQVTSVRWHPDAHRREARLQVEQAGPLDVQEGDIVVGVLVETIRPAAVEIRVGAETRVIAVSP